MSAPSDAGKYTAGSFSLSSNNKKNGNRPLEETNKMKCYKSLIYEQFIQVSVLCGPQFLSYLGKVYLI